jgi:hypothetical protein
MEISGGRRLIIHYPTLRPIHKLLVDLLFPIALFRLWFYPIHQGLSKKFLKIRP